MAHSLLAVFPDFYSSFPDTADNTSEYKAAALGLWAHLDISDNSPNLQPFYPCSRYVTVIDQSVHVSTQSSVRRCTTCRECDCSRFPFVTACLKPAYSVCKCPSFTLALLILVDSYLCQRFATHQDQSVEYSKGNSIPHQTTSRHFVVLECCDTVGWVI